MAVSSASTLQGIHAQIGSVSKKAVTSDFSAVIEGFGGSQYLLTKQAPWNVLTPGEPLEVSGPLGTFTYQAAQTKIAHSGAMTFVETVDGFVDNMLIALLLSGGTFEMTVYEGIPNRFTRAKRYRDCIFVADPVDRDWESRNQPLLVTGTLYCTYVGEDIAGNVESLDG